MKHPRAPKPAKVSDAVQRFRAIFYRPAKTDVAAQLGVTPETVSRLLAGRYQPSLELALRIEREFGIPANLWAPAGDRWPLLPPSHDLTGPTA